MANPKGHLNSLYGIFGRACEQNQTILIKKEDVDQLFLSLCIKSMVEITKDYYLITYKNNVDPEISKMLDVNFEGVSEGVVDISNNVAIASAVTAYARIHMMQFKVGDIGDSLCYTDTDSIFTSKELPVSMLGSELGLMKDELDGGLIHQAYFLGIKRYLLVLEEGKTKSVWAGVPKNTLSLDDFKLLLSGEVLNREYDNTFFKSMMDMTITIKSRSITLEKNHAKPLVEDMYMPLHVSCIEGIDIKSDIISKKVNYYTKIFLKIQKLFKIINKPHRVCVIYNKVSFLNCQSTPFLENRETEYYRMFYRHYYISLREAGPC